MSSDLISPQFGIANALRLFQPDPSEPGLPYVVQAQLGNHRYLPKDEHTKLSASGKGMSVERARECALGEAVERYSSLCFWPQEMVRRRRGELDARSLDPADLVLYRPEQYDRVRYAPYSEDRELAWVPAWSLAREERIYVPACAVLMGYSPGSQEQLLGVTSNGVATGGSLATAIHGAAIELIERDAFIIGWENRLVRARWDPRTHPSAEVRHLVELYRRRGIHLHLFQLATDLDVAAFFALGIAEQDRGPVLPAAVAGLGADTDLCRAAAKAVLEVGQIRPALRRKLRQNDVRERMDELLGDPTRVAELEDHDLLYAHPKALDKLDFLLSLPIDREDWSGAPRMPEDLTWLVEHLRERGHELIYYNLTPPDMGRLGLYTARVILPGFQPIDFGWYERRLGGERLYRLPVELGLRQEPLAPDELNPHPHPIA